MRYRRGTRLLVALVLAVGTRLVYAVPAETADELWAVSHCTQHTGHPTSIPGARRCCGVSSEADTPAIGSTAATPAPALPVLLPGVVPTLTSSTPSVTPRSLAASVRDGPPRYLALLTIRR